LKIPHYFNNRQDVTMANLSKSEENYIEHEVQIRVHEEKFKVIEKRFDQMDNKLNLIIGIVLGSVVIPVVLHLFGRV